MKGILFKPEMIKATVERWKTNTRRAEAGLKEINEHPSEWIFKGVQEDGKFWFQHPQCERDDWLYNRYIKPRYQVGETVYIKEAWCESYYGKPICYKLDGKESPGPKGFWRSPMFLMAINARYFIKILGNSAELLRLPLSPEEMKLEGGEAALPMTEKINGLWVFRYEFEYIAKQRQS